jgi:cell wall-associated NlpC family hydrolase
VTALLVLLLLASVIPAVFAAPAGAVNPPGPHDPIGAVEKIVRNADQSLRFTGWAADPDLLTANAVVQVVIDGRVVRGVPTTIARPLITSRQHTGPTPGFDLTVLGARTGTHTVCVAVRNLGVGVARVLRCVATPAGTYLDPAAHSPQGAVTSATADADSMTVAGWTIEPDYLGRRSTVVLYVDGAPASTVIAGWSATDRTATGARLGAFSITVPVAPGAHLGCVWVVNVGPGSNSSYGCSTVDTRGPAGTSAVTTPAVNKTVVKQAKSHVGDPYRWGAAGPGSFDCSGLVIFSYGKAGMKTLPRIAADQFTAARVIPASRAVPGDLVFYHDSVGAVYHVGIYLSPGNTVAAIDENQGVNYQRIWDPDSATYGSFTHT